MKITHMSFLFGAVVVGAFCLLPSEGADSTSAGQPKKEPAAKPYGIDKRTPWKTSRITGAPEPPPPYKIERAFPKLTFKNPLLLTTAPGSKRFFVCEQAGKIYSFPIDPN